MAPFHRKVSALRIQWIYSIYMCIWTSFILLLHLSDSVSATSTYVATLIPNTLISLSDFPACVQLSRVSWVDQEQLYLHQLLRCPLDYFSREKATPPTTLVIQPGDLSVCCCVSHTLIKVLFFINAGFLTSTVLEGMRQIILRWWEGEGDWVCVCVWTPLPL